MINDNTDIFKDIDNFKKIENVQCQVVFESTIINPKFTIVIPTFKREKFLKMALDSALMQVGCEEFDVIVIDNDPSRLCNTELLMSKYDSEIRLSYYKNSQNIGMFGNWNRLLEKAKGEWVIMLHDDDMLMPNFIFECEQILKKNSNILYLKTAKYFLKNKILTTSKKELNCLLKTPFTYFRGILGGPPSGVLIKKDNAIEVGGYSDEYYPTSDFVFEVNFLRKYPKSIYITSKLLTIYRYEENESLKIEILSGFVRNDYFLLKQLFKSYNIPDFISRIYLRYKTQRSICALLDFNNQFSFDMSKELGIKPVFHYWGKTISLFFRFLDLFI